MIVWVIAWGVENLYTISGTCTCMEAATQLHQDSPYSELPDQPDNDILFGLVTVSLKHCNNNGRCIHYPSACWIGCCMDDTSVQILWYNKRGQKWLTHAHCWKSSYMALTSQRLPWKKLKEEAAVVHCASELLPEHLEQLAITTCITSGQLSQGPKFIVALPCQWI